MVHGLPSEARIEVFDWSHGDWLVKCWSLAGVIGFQVNPPGYTDALQEAGVRGVIETLQELINEFGG